MTDNDALEITYVVEGNNTVEFTALEYSFDLLDHPQFTINKRTKAMMPNPFVITDAIVVKRTFNTNSLKKKSEDSIFINTPPIHE